MNNHETSKVMIVDDEELARKFVISSLDWEHFGLEIIAEASSGLEAMTVLEEQTPDIIFMDIRMPYMNGLELSQFILRRYPQIKIVILTAFKDFEYAQKSIHIGVSHFLLKPINPTELTATVLKLKEQITEEKRQWFELDHLRKLLKSNYSFLRERFLLDYMENGTSMPLSPQQLSYYFLQGVPDYIQVTLLEARSASFLEASEEERLLQDMKHLEFIKSRLGDEKRTEVLTDQKHHVILLSYSPEIQMVPLCEQLQHSIRQLSGAHLMFGIGNAYHSFSQLNLSFQESLEALKFSQYMPSQSITIYQNDIHVQNSSWHMERSSLEDVQFYIKAGLSEPLNELLPALYLDTEGRLISPDNARILSMSLLSAGINVANDIGIPLQELFDQEARSFLPILLENTSNALQSGTLLYLNRLTASIASYRSSRSKSVLWDIIQYVQKEMSNPELTLNAVAEKFHMNGSYLSRTFTKELGFSFSKYLNRLRMERAIELLSTTDLKAYQIAEAVGIPDAYYFSNCFKKYTGKSIRDYKKESGLGR